MGPCNSLIQYNIPANGNGRLYNQIYWSRLYSIDLFQPLKRLQMDTQWQTSEFSVKNWPWMVLNILSQIPNPIPSWRKNPIKSSTERHLPPRQLSYKFLRCFWQHLHYNTNFVSLKDFHYNGRIIGGSWTQLYKQLANCWKTSIGTTNNYNGFNRTNLTIWQNYSWPSLDGSYRGWAPCHCRGRTCF